RHLPSSSPFAPCIMTTRLSRRSLLQTAALTASLALPLRHARGAQRPAMNEAIDSAWQAGLAALKPSEKELERGLALHAESLVFDCYGFSPRCAVDGDAIAKAVVAGASHEEQQDLREDMSMTR